MPLNAPNLVTLSRIILIPLLIAIYYLPDTWLSEHGKNVTATVVFIFAGITDWLDGYLARRLNQMSAFGAFLDPVADKLIVVPRCCPALPESRRHDRRADHRRRDRDLGAAGVDGEGRAGEKRRRGVHRQAEDRGQMVAIPLLLFHDQLLGMDCQWLGTVLINVAAVLTVMSMLYYLRKALPTPRCGVDL